MTLTAAGRLLMHYANETRTRLDVLHNQIAEFDGLDRGHVDIACVEGLLSGLMPQFVRNYLGRHSRIGLSVVALGSMAVAEAVAENRVDLAIVFGQSPRSDLLELARMKQPLCVIVSAAHALARKRSCRLADAPQYRVVLPDRSFGIRQ
jgi:DNA-binding transcriptional LysR family regulator